MCRGQAIPGGYRIGDVVYSLIFHVNKGGSFGPGAKGTVTGAADNNCDTMLEVEFEGYGSKMAMRLTQISRDPDPNTVK